MKKLFALFIPIAMLFAVLLPILPTSYATDVCSNDAHSDADFYVETTRASWLMSQSCVDSEIVTTMPQGSVMHVVGKTEGWHKLVTESGLQGWMWEDFVTPTTKSFNPVSEEPESATEPEVEYIAMYDISGHKYEEAIWYVYNNGIVEGYEDGSYQPDRNINRAELLKIIVEAKYDNEFESYADTTCFPDVPVDQWYNKYVCFAKAEGIVQGYEDNTFRPANTINFVEALKIAMIGFGYEYTEDDPWYKDIVDDASVKDFIPLDVDSFDEYFTRGQMAELITRMMKYEDGTLDAYTGTGDSTYYVTYYSIEAGINVEELKDTGKCVYYASILEEGQEADGCFCDEGGSMTCVDK